MVSDGHVLLCGVGRFVRRTPPLRYVAALAAGEVSLLWPDMAARCENGRLYRYRRHHSARRRHSRVLRRTICCKIARRRRL